jgi:predicted Abi (CAAX) family protease
MISLLLIGWLGLQLGLPKPLPEPQASSYEQAQQAAFNRPGYFPIAPLPADLAPWYRPVADWSGRLILPASTDYQQDPGDWVWIELHNAPYPDLIGQIVKLTWQPLPAIQTLVETVTVNVSMGEAAARSRRKGDVVPDRLDGRQQVGPLQSLAGARPADDVWVRLSQVTLQPQGERPVLAIAAAPVQITGRQVALVQIETAVPAPASPPTDCPGALPCPSEYFQVRHYNPDTQAFDGLSTVVRIPQQPRDRNGRFMSTIRDLANSPAGRLGWYLYGAFDADQTFMVQALQPRSLLQLTPDQVILERTAGLNFITWQNWRRVQTLKGRLQRTLVAPEAAAAATALADWQVGDRGLVIHLFGGIGGDLAEGGTPGTVTGHFSYGVAAVVRDRFTQEPQFAITYHQIYGHNPNAIVSGTIDWSAYTGHLERGWLGARPISDVIIKLDTFTAPFDLGSRSLSLLDTLLQETRIIAARYRTGDGTGVAPVTPATSCVQDSSQALYIAIETLKRQALSTPEIATRLETNPQDPDAQQFGEFVQLGQDLENLLTPYGVVRSDWQQNAEALAGVNRRDRFVSSQNIVNVLLSWRSMMPRRAHDDLSRVFLDHGAQLWFLRTNQVGGWDPTILPLAPTELFGKWPLVGTLLKRLSNAVSTPLTGRTLLIGLIALVGYGAIALPYGLRTGFLQITATPVSGFLHPTGLFRLLLMPAMVEETVFRVFLLPHPLEGVSPVRWLLWALLSLSLFLLYHPLNARWFYPPGRGTFRDRRFLVLAGLLGLVCTVVYGLTGSFWAIVLLHWFVVILWLKVLGGNRRLHADTAHAPVNARIKRSR